MANPLSTGPPKYIPDMPEILVHFLQLFGDQKESLTDRDLIKTTWDIPSIGR